MLDSATLIVRQGLQSGPLTRNGELHFRSLLEKLPAGAYTCNPDGLITYFNQHAVQLWGRSPKLNDPVDRFCGSFKLYAVDGSPITHDQCWMALALKDRLEYNGHEIIIERPDAVKAAKEFRPRVALLDIGLPGINGYEVARKLRAETSGERTVVIAISGWGREVDRERSEAAGFAHHLVKPVDPDALSKLLAELPEA